jgi:hypothetical protein
MPQQLRSGRLSRPGSAAARRWTRWFNIRAWMPAFALSYQDSLVLEKPGA